MMFRMHGRDDKLHKILFREPEVTGFFGMSELHVGLLMPQNYS
jgi:hypothetical protein